MCLKLMGLTKLDGLLPSLQNVVSSAYAQYCLSGFNWNNAQLYAGLILGYAMS